LRQPRYDAIRSDGQKLQVKINFAASQIGFGAKPTYLCLKIDLNGDWIAIYYGDFKLLKQAARYSARDKEHMVTVTAPQNIAKSGYVPPKYLPIVENLTDAGGPI
jgi:hypothetical protein